MATTGEQLNVSELDFNNIKANLVNYFKNSETEFTDWDFEGSNLNNIIDLLAYNTHYNAMLAHMAVNESFIDSAQLRSSVVSAAKLLGYIPRSYSAAKAVLTGTLIANDDSAEEYILPRGTRLTTTYNNNSFSFVVLDDVCTFKKVQDGLSYYYEIVNDPNDPDNADKNVLIAYQGRLVTASFEANAFNDGQRYELDDENIDTSTLRVIVYPTAAKSPGTGTRFNQYTDINVGPETPIYFLNENAFGRYELTFGNGTFGRKLKAGQVIEVQYLVTDGKAANGINTAFTITGDTSGNLNATGPLTLVTNASGEIQRVSGGSNKETVQRLKENAINSFTTQNRAVTADDYRNLITANFPYIQSISAWGGEDNEPPMYGQAFISVKPHSPYPTDSITETDKATILAYLNNKKILAITPTIVDPEYCNIVLDVLIKYNPNISSLSASELQNEILNNVVIPYNENVINGFDTIFRHSQFNRLVDTYNSSILNSLVRVYVRQTFTIPGDGRVSTFMVKFGTKLTPDDDNTIINTTTSPSWKLNGDTVYIADEPSTVSTYLRNVYTYRLIGNNKKTVSRIRNVGTINLSTGIMTLDGVYADEDTTVTLTVNTESNDIVGKRNLLLEIDTANSFIRAYPDEISRGGSSRSVNYATFKKDR